MLYCQVIGTSYYPRGSIEQRSIPCPEVVQNIGRSLSSTQIIQSTAECSPSFGIASSSFSFAWQSIVWRCILPLTLTSSLHIRPYLGSFSLSAFSQAPVYGPSAYFHDPLYY